MNTGLHAKSGETRTLVETVRRLHGLIARQEGRRTGVIGLLTCCIGQYRSPVVQHRSMVTHLDGPYRAMDGPFAGPLDGLCAGQVRATTGPHRSDDRSPPEREISMPVNRPGSRAADGPSRLPDGPCRSPERTPTGPRQSPDQTLTGPCRSPEWTPTGPRRSPDGPLQSNDGPPPEIAYLVDLGMPEAPKVSKGHILKSRKSEATPFKMEEDGNGHSKGLAPHKVRGSPVPADETSDEDADEPPPTGRRRSGEKQHRASKRRHHKLEVETNGVSDGLKTKVRDRHRRDDSPGSSSSSSRSSSGHRKWDDRRSPRQGSNRKSPDPPDKGNGRDKKRENLPPDGGDGRKPDKDEGKTPDKADKPPAKDSGKPKMPCPPADTKRVTSSYVSNRLGRYDGTTCLETFLARFDRCIKYMGWNAEDQQFNLSVSLDGVAGQILWDTEACSAVEGTIQLLRNRFGNVNQAKRFRAELCARKRKPGECLQELYQDVCRLMSLAYP